VANAGRVEVNIVAVGEDKLSAMLAKVNTNMDATKATMDRAAAATRASSLITAGFTDSLRANIKPMNGFRELVNQVKENVGFLAGGVIALGTTIIGLASDLVKTEKQLDSTSAEMFKAVGESAKLTRELGNVATAAGQASSASKGFEVRVANLGAQIARLRGDAKLAEAFEQQARIAQTQGNIAAVEADLQKADDAANTTLAKVYDLRKQEQNLRTQVASLNATIAKTEAESGMVNERLRSQLGAASLRLTAVAVNTQIAETAFRSAARAASQFSEELVYLDELELAQGAAKPGVGGGGVGGGGGSRPTARAAGPGSQIVMSDPDVIRQVEEGLSGLTIAAREGLDISGLFGKALKDEIAVGFRDIRDSGLEAADAIMSVSDALTNSMSAAFPDIGAGLTEVTAHMQRYRAEMERLDEQVKNGASATDAQKKATDNLTTTIIGSGTAIAASVAKQLGGLRAEYIVRSAGEFAAGVATSFTNPAEAASHFSASVLYGIAAAKAGGGGGGGGGKGGGGGGTQRTSQNGQITGSGGGGGTTVFNFSTLVTDRQQVRQAVNQVMARRDRSGYRQREGA